MKLIGRFGFIALFFVLASPPPVVAQITNGDFSDGLNGWTVEQPLPSAVVLAPTHGWQINAFNGEATFLVAATETPAEEGHIRQEFDCGSSPGQNQLCEITFDYRLIHHSGDPQAAAITMYIDSELLFLSQEISEDLEFLTTTITVPCGTHEIGLCLFVDTGIGGWTASFDNVVAECVVATPTRPSTWGRIKQLYR